MKFLKADKKIPYMGLNNKICKDPVYWCRLHEVWLSEEDVVRKQCRCKPTFDMLDTKPCYNLEKRGD